MHAYDINQGKRKKAIRQVVKVNTKNAKGFVKFCYGLTWFLRILAIILGLANILYVAYLSSYIVDIVYPIMAFGVPYGFSFLSATVYIISASREYSFRKRETIILEDNGFVYSYHDDRIVLLDTIFVFRAAYENICKYDYDAKTKILTLYGKIVGYIYENGEQKEICEINEVSLLDTYDVSLKQLLDNNC